MCRYMLLLRGITRNFALGRDSGEQEAICVCCGRGSRLPSVGETYGAQTAAVGQAIQGHHFDTLNQHLQWYPTYPCTITVLLPVWNLYVFNHFYVAFLLP